MWYTVGPVVATHRDLLPVTRPAVTGIGVGRFTIPDTSSVRASILVSDSSRHRPPFPS